MIRLAIYGPSLPAIEERLYALGLDLDLHLFDAEGGISRGGVALDPAEVELDYVWLRHDVITDGAMGRIMETVLACRHVDVFQSFNAGLDHPFFRKAAAKGVRLSNSSAQGIAIAEYVFGQVLALFQPIAEQRAAQARKDWVKTPFREVAGTRWLIFGYGPIGAALAKRAGAFDAVVDVIRRDTAPLPGVARVGALDDAEAFLPDADVVVLACPLNDATRGLAGAGFFEAMKPGAVLVNIARGEVINTPALMLGLDAGRPGMAVLDVFDVEPLPKSDPLWTHPNVVVTGHTSFNGSGTVGRWDQLFLDGITAYARDGGIVRAVDVSVL